MLGHIAAPLTLVALGAKTASASTRWPQPADSYAPIETDQKCAYAGQLFPPPAHAADAPAILAAESALHDQLDTALLEGGAGGLVEINSTFFSIAVFSAADKNGGPIFDYHYAVAGMENATGGRELDNDSVYRIGSITKVLSVYALLAARGDRDFATPITEFLSDLETGSGDGNDDWERIQWEDITVEALTSHMAGLPRDYAWPDYTTVANGSSLAPLGVNSSKLSLEDYPECGLPAPGFTPDLTLCDRERLFSREFIHGLNKLGPYFPVFESPTYSNAAFRLLGHVLESMTGEAFETTFNREIADALDLSSTTVMTPDDDTRGVIPGGKTAAWWGIDLGDENPAGSVYSTINDMTTIGRSILRSTLIPRALTRRWFKPHSRTADDTHAVGAPWEITSTRIPLDIPRNSANTKNTSSPSSATTRVDLYTKGGTIGAYSASFGLDPDREWGYVVLAAGAASSAPSFYLADLVARAFAPAFQAAARDEAASRFAGTYAQHGEGANGTLTLEVHPGQPGIAVTEWVSNGVDVLAAVPAVNLVGGGMTSVTLYPARLKGEGKVAFRAGLEAVPNADFGGPVESACLSWLTADPAQVADRMLDDVVVGVDPETGRAEWVEMRAWRERYVRVE